MTRKQFQYCKEIIINNFKKLIVLTSLYIVLQIIIGGCILTGYSNYINEQINYNVSKYKQIDYQQICDISSCGKLILKDGTTFYADGSGKIFKGGGINLNYMIQDINDVSITFYMEFVIVNELSGITVILNTETIESLLIQSSLIITPLLLLFTIIILGLSIKEEREFSLRALAGNEALLANKSMILITENIHHELNTPMEVIDNKIHKSHKVLTEYLQEEYSNWRGFQKENNLDETDYNYYKSEERRAFNRKLLKMEEDFEFIKESSESVYAVLERMRGFKHLRYSNGNKSISSIIEGAFKLISVSNSNFECNVDEELRKYTINSDTFKNADLLNIIINHIKNSLEANSNKIHIIFTAGNKDFITFRIIDNGNGIKQSNRKNIFEPNFSTKVIGVNGIRGNGLYLNKSILKSGGGDVKLIDSTRYGTTFEIKVPAKPGKWARLYQETNT